MSLTSSFAQLSLSPSSVMKSDAASASGIYDLPEELLERVIELVFLSRSNPHQRTSRIAPLYVSQQWNRIGTPLVYKEVELHSCRSASMLLETLTAGTLRADLLARCVRSLRSGAVWSSLGEIMDALCAASGECSLDTLDVTLDAGCCVAECACSLEESSSPSPPPSPLSPQACSPSSSGEQGLICSALPFRTALLHPALKRSMKVLRVRKAQGVYLTAPKVRCVLIGLADAVKGWTSLEKAELLFKMSDDSNARNVLVPGLQSMPTPTLTSPTTTSPTAFPAAATTSSVPTILIPVPRSSSSPSLPSLASSAPSSSSVAAGISAHHHNQRYPSASPSHSGSLSPSPPRPAQTIRRNTDGASAHPPIQSRTGRDDASPAHTHFGGDRTTHMRTRMSGFEVGSSSSPSAVVASTSNSTSSRQEQGHGQREAQAQSFVPAVNGGGDGATIDTDHSPSQQEPQQLGGPISQLTNALRQSPSLKSFTTYLPTLWNNTVLVVSANEALERIVLLDGDAIPSPTSASSSSFLSPSSSYLSGGAGGLGPRRMSTCSFPGSSSSSSSSSVVGITATGMFMMEAKKHARLVELIRAGTVIMRSRAHTQAGLLKSSWGVPPASTSGSGFVIRK